jgi:hypothetical protein
VLAPALAHGQLGVDAHERHGAGGGWAHPMAPLCGVSGAVRLSGTVSFVDQYRTLDPEEQGGVARLVAWA